MVNESVEYLHANIWRNKLILGQTECHANMLSYMTPVGDTNHPSQNLSLDLNLDSENLKPTICAANETSDKKCLPTIFESKNINITFKQTIKDNNSFLKTNMASSDVQRPKSLDKLNTALQPQVTNMEVINLDAGNTVGGSILLGASSNACVPNEGKPAKPSKLGNTKNAALKR